MNSGERLFSWIITFCPSNFIGWRVVGLHKDPRQPYDTKLLYENEGLAEDLFSTFLTYVTSSPCPAHELLNPNLTGPTKKSFRAWPGQPSVVIH
ncbi:hypothetical protein CXF94_21615 [Halomonas sp. Choline-3u-9]|nr:hypothetical protein CXF94_21615 [Halomonas sp. Choline-3u-9]